MRAILVRALIVVTFPFHAWGQQSAMPRPTAAALKNNDKPGLELSRPVRKWEFLDVVGKRAGLFGREDGRFEGWVYPLKLVRDFHLVFHFNGLAIPAENFARTLVVRPESTTIIYGNDSFAVRETLCVPPGERGAFVKLEIDTFEPLEVEARFKKDFQLMWPAAIGGTYLNWNGTLKAFTFGEESKKYFGILGSPSAAAHGQEQSNNNFSADEDSLFLGPSKKGKDTRLIVLAGSVTSQADAEKTYQRLTNESQQLQEQASQYYRDYLAKTVNLSLPDPELQKAYDWSRISTVQGLVENPFLGTGLVAGYRTSGNDARPGFAWFFGRDSLWTSLALNSTGDFSTTRTALDFLSRFQRADGKVEHEISQSASLVDWFKAYPYGYASADATPLFIIGMDDYVSASGDSGFAREKWDNIWRAYQFLRSTYDERGLPQNLNVGHGWVEGGPLLPVKTELYQSGLGLQALRSLARIATIVGKKDLQAGLQKEIQQKQRLINDAFWSEEKKSFGFALDKDNKRVDVTTVLSTVPMWFGLLDEARSNATIDQLADADHATDWGMRILSAKNQLFDPTGYHFGSVWPLFTGWAAVGEYEYHRPLPAYANLRANAQLALDGPLGRVTEVLSGSYNTQLATSSPHQIWSSAMVISPILRGMMGLKNMRTERRLLFAPHVPPGWDHFVISELPACDGTASIAYTRSAVSFDLEIFTKSAGSCTLEFSPALSPRAQVLGAEWNGKRIEWKTEPHAADMHANLAVQLPEGKTHLAIQVTDDFGLSVENELPAIGLPSSNLKIVSETWNAAHDELQLQTAGIAGKSYAIGLFGSKVTLTEGGTLESRDGMQRLKVTFPPAESAGYTHQKVLIHFAERR